MKYEIKDRGEAIVVAVHGDIDLVHSAPLRAALIDSVGRGRVVVVDLAGVSVIDSSGVASLLEAFQTARKRGKRLLLARVGDSVMRVLRLARLDKVFAIHETVERALEK
jgi:anti-sigma B factor antagonist